MAKTYEALMAQIKSLQGKAKRLGKRRDRAIATINSLIRKFAVSMTELNLSGSSRRVRAVKQKVKASAKRTKRRTKKILPKYRGPGGATWSGRGLMPVWLREAVAKGKKKEDFLIGKAKG